MVKDDIIQFDGIDLLTAAEKKILNKLSTEYFRKIKRMVNNLVSMKVHINAHESKGKKKKYSFHVKVVVPSKIPYVSTKSNEWDLTKGLHKAFTDVMMQIKKKFKITSGRRYRKPYE